MRPNVRCAHRRGDDKHIGTTDREGALAAINELHQGMQDNNPPPWRALREHDALQQCAAALDRRKREMSALKLSLSERAARLPIDPMRRVSRDALCPGVTRIAEHTSVRRTVLLVEPSRRTLRARNGVQGRDGSTAGLSICLTVD